MQRSNVWRTLTRVSVGGVFAVTLALSACGGGTSSAGGPDVKKIVIATELPVVGTDASVGLPTQYGADLAIQQNANLPNGYTLSVLHMNYAGASGPDASIATSNAHQLVANASVLGVVGTFNSGIEKVEMPISNAAGLTYISPANTNPGLTLQQYAADNGINFTQLHPAGKANAYFRIPGTDVVQGKVDAQVAAAAPVSCKSAFVVDDSSTYGKGLANFFTTNFTGSGGTIAGSTEITTAQLSNLPSLAATIISKSPDCVFYGGVTSGGGGALKKDLVAAGYSKPMVGGDGIADDPGFIQAAGAAASVNTYGSVAAPDTSTFTSGAAATFTTGYTNFTKGLPNNDLLPYSAMSYDAAGILIQAIKSVIAAGKPVNRDTVRAAVQSISYDGVTGKISFDANGDNAGNKVFSIYAVDSTSNGAWAFKQQLNA